MSLITDIDNALYGGLDSFAREKPYNAAFIGSIPIVGDFARMHEQHRYLSDYVRGRGFSWKDVQYPFATANSYLPEFSSTASQLMRGYGRKRSRKFGRRKKRYSRYYRRR